MLLPRGCGSWSSHVVAEAAQLVELPNEADPQQLAMMTINPPTAALLLSEFVRLDPGRVGDPERGQLGSRPLPGATRPCTAANGRSTSCAGRTRPRSCKEAGGDVVVTDDDHLARRVAEATGGAEIRLGIDAVGGTATGRLADCLCRDAILVNYGRMSGAPCTVQPDAFVFRNLTLRGFWLASWFRSTPEGERAALLGEIAGLIAKGTLHAPIHATYDLSEIKEAVAVAASGGRSGKVLIVPRH